MRDTPCESSQARHYAIQYRYQLQISVLARSKHVPRFPRKRNVQRSTIKSRETLILLSFFFSLSLLSRHFSLPFFSLFFSSSSFRPRPAQWFAWNKAWGSETSRRIRYVDMWESTSRRRTIGPTLIAILHRMLRNAPLHPDNLATLWYMNDVVVFHGHNALYFVNALQPTTKIFQNKWFFISSEFSILFFILELGNRI